MSTVVSYLPPPHAGHPVADYPWNEWFDGQIHRLRRGTRIVPGEFDYTVKPQTLRSQALREAQTRGITITTRLRDDVLTIVKISDSRIPKTQA
jgi:hypothetical protein